MMEVRQTLVSHSHVHNDLLLYQDLTKWLKECLPDIFAELKEVRMLLLVLKVKCECCGGYVYRLTSGHSSMFMKTN